MRKLRTSELIIVIAIILTAAIFAVTHVEKSMNRAFTKELLEQIAREIGEAPTISIPEDLAARLLAVGRYEWNGHLQEGKAVADIWGTPIKIDSQSPSILKIQSAGKDTVFDTNDDQSLALTLNKPASGHPAALMAP